MTNPLTQTRDTLWSILDADVNLSAFIGDGRRHRFNGTGIATDQIAPTDCPCLTIEPGPMPIQWPTPRHPNLDYSLKVHGVIIDQQAGPIEEFFYLVYTTLMNNFPDLGQPDVKGFNITQLEFDRADHRTCDTPRWSFSFRLVVTLRQNLDDFSAP